MSTGNHIKNYTVADIEKYHKGLLSQKERHDLEKAALDDPFLADALEGYVVAGVNAQADLTELKQRLANRTGTAKVIPIGSEKKERKAIPWLRIAAMLVILVGAGLLANQLLFKNKKDKELAVITQKNEQVRPTDTATSNSTLSDTIHFDAISATKDDKSVTTNKSQPATVTKESSGATISNNNTVVANDIKAPVIARGIEDTVKNNVKEGERKALTYEPVKQEDAKKLQQQKSVEDLAKKRNVTTNAPAASGNKGNELVTTRTEKQDVAGYYKTKDKDVASKREADNFYDSRAYVYRGRVTDNNNRGLPFANVTNVRDNIGTYTDAFGNFTLTSPDTTLNIRVRSVAFEDNTVQLRNDVSTNQVVMQDDRQNLSEVVVSNQKLNAERRQRDLSANMKLDEPEPADGWEKYDAYLLNNLQPPNDYRSKQDGGKQEVEVSFEVDKNGEPVNIRVEKSLCKTCDKEAIRLVKEGPKWKRKAKKGRTTVTISF